MIGGFDKFSNYEVPTVTLCNPSAKATIDANGRVKLSNAIGILTDTKGTHLKLNFNAPHEVSFDYERHISENPIKQSFYNDIYNGIESERYVFVEGVGFYSIKSLTDSDEDGVDKKSATCRSCEVEHENFEGVNIVEDTAYVLHNAEGTGLLDLYIAGCPNWTIKYIDPVLLYKNGIDGEARVFTFDKIDAEDGYKFLWETIQDGCECIVEPDILTRELSFYSRELYAQEHKTDILIAYFNLLKHRVIEAGDEDKWTALNVLGKDEDLRISMVNPTGMNTLYNFTYRYAWMSTELQEALDKWQAKIDSVEDEYYQKISEYTPQRDDLWSAEQNLAKLNTELEQLQKTRDITITQYGDSQQSVLNNVNSQIADKNTEIANAKTYYNNLKVQVKNTYEIPLAQINAKCRLGLTAQDENDNYIFATVVNNSYDGEIVPRKFCSNCGTEVTTENKCPNCESQTFIQLVSNGLLEELAPHIKATDYNDEYLKLPERNPDDEHWWTKAYEIAKQLYDRAKSQMVKLSSGKKTVKIDTASFLFNERFKHFSDQLIAGAIINAEITKDTIEEWHLTGIDIDFDERKTDFTLGNKYDRSDLKSLFEDTLGSHSKAASDLKYLKSLIEEQEKRLDYTINWAEHLRTLSLENILKSENQEVVINDRGYWGRQVIGEDSLGNPIYDDEQIKIVHNTVAITNDNWGHIATVFGKIAVGYNNDGSIKYKYGQNGEVIIGNMFFGETLNLFGGTKDGNGNYSISLNHEGLTIKNDGASAGIQIVDAQGNKQFYADNNGNLNLLGHIIANGGDIAGWEIQGEYYRLYYNYDEQFAVQVRCPTELGSSNSDNDARGVFSVAVNTDDGWIYPFLVSSDGSFKSTKGNIGGWDLSNGRLVSKDSENRYCGIGLYGTAYAFYANAKDIGGGDGLFRVDHSGKLIAENAEITGTVKAGSVLSYGVKIDSDGEFIRSSVASQHGTHYGVKMKSNDGDHYIFVSNDMIKFEGKSSVHGFTSYISINPVTYEDGSGIVLDTHFGRLNGTWAADACLGTISDNKKKNSIESLDNRYDIFFDNIHSIRHKYNNGTSNRYHTSFIAQDVEEALQLSKLTTQEFAGLIINENNDYYLRYEEFISLNTWQIQKLKSKVFELEQKIKQLLTNKS